MIKEFVEAWYANQEAMQDKFKTHPESYFDVVKAVVSMLAEATAEEYTHIDPERIHEINDGDYQGTLLYVIGASDYQPNDYWYVKVGYGSCSGCDTLYSISGYSDEPPTEGQVKDYMTLALHVVQGLRKMGEESV